MSSGSTWNPPPPFRIKGIAEHPALAPGKLGAFDSHGVMPTAVVPRNDELWMYYIGWTVRADVPYHNAIGVARSADGGRTFERLVPGPVVGTGPHEPYFCGTGDVAKIGDRWVIWYMSATEWRIVAGKPEPRYHLKQAWSDDGIIWSQDGQTAVDYENDEEGGVARATVLKRPDGYWMWFCHRGIADYRGRGANAYRLGIRRTPPMGKIGNGLSNSRCSVLRPTRAISMNSWNVIQRLLKSRTLHICSITALISAKPASATPRFPMGCSVEANV